MKSSRKMQVTKSCAKYLALALKPLKSIKLTASGGRCPALCLRGGRGLTWVTWRKGEPLVGSVDKHSQDAEWLRGARCWGAGGVGEGLASSPKPAARQGNLINLLILKAGPVLTGW